MITIKIVPTGMIVVSDIINGQRVKEKYIGYSLGEAKRKFRKKYLQ